jgi:DNA-binding NtrC family response regulator
VDPTATVTGMPEKRRVQSAPLCLVVVFSPDRRRLGDRIQLVGATVAGREGGSNLQLPLEDGRMSRRHVRFEYLESFGVVGVEDLGSKNGLFVDGRRQRQATITHNQVVRMGNTVLVVDKGPADQSGSHAAALLNAELDRAGAVDLPVLLHGETGSGKEVAARRLHEASGRRGSFVAVNCAAIPETLAEASFFGHKKGAWTGADTSGAGLFAEAGAGTLLLDEIGDLPSSLQPKLLRVLETGEYRAVGSTRTHRAAARIVAATHVALEKAIETGRFRADLYARLAVLPITVPPLRDRRADILDLARLFLKDHPDKHLSPDAAVALLLNPWPLNVRGLRSTLLRAAVLGDGTLTPESLGLDEESPTEEITLSPSGVPPREELVGLLEAHRGVVAKVAAHYGKDRKQIYRWLRQYGLEPAAFR